MVLYRHNTERMEDAVSFEELAASQRDLQKRVRKSNEAQKALKKARRKLKKDLAASSTAEIKILLGMAKIAVEKSETIARLKL